MPSTGGRAAASSAAIAWGGRRRRRASSKATGQASSPSAGWGGRSTAADSSSPERSRIAAVSAWRKCSSSRWYTGSSGEWPRWRLLQPRAERDVFGEGAENGAAIRSGGGDDHAVRFHTPQTPRLQIDHHHDAPPDQFFRPVGTGNAGHHLAHLTANVHLQTQQAVGSGHRLGGTNFTHAHIHTREIVDGDPR